MIQRMVGKQAPDFTMDAVLADKSFGKVSLEENMKNDKWTVLFFYPMDFTFVCPTEITAMSDRYDEFEDLRCRSYWCIHGYNPHASCMDQHRS